MLNKFPGYFGYGGIMAIHADWPIYPNGIGWQFALKAMGNYPKGTNFYEIDDIDRCKLFISQDPKQLKDPSDAKYYHVGIWHSDLVELNLKGYVTGVVEMSDYEFEMMRFNQVKKQLGKNLKEDDEGNIILLTYNDRKEVIELKYSKPEYFEDAHDFIDCVFIPESVTLTEEGFEELEKLLNNINLSEELRRLSEPFINIGRYDTAIRESSLFVEETIKKFHMQNDLYGQRLIDYHINEIINNNENFNSAAIKSYRGELRTVMKFIRNDFMHNFKILSEAQCKAILSRINELIIEFLEVKSAYFKNN
ncbi:hypothetical protein [Spirosoma pulveris]